MAAQYLVYLLLFSALASTLLLRRRRRRRVARRLAADEGSLWTGLAAGLFDSADSPPSARLEIALLAIAKRLRLKGGIVVRLDGDSMRVVAASAASEHLLDGLDRGATLPRRALYCGSVPAGSTLAVDYASLSEWRKHEACATRGWEAFLGVDCGELSGVRIVAGFFDTTPRDQLFTRAEAHLLDQMAPWLGALAGQEESLPVSASRTARDEQEERQL